MPKAKTPAIPTAPELKEGVTVLKPEEQSDRVLQHLLEQKANVERKLKTRIPAQPKGLQKGPKQLAENKLEHIDELIKKQRAKIAAEKPNG